MGDAEVAPPSGAVTFLFTDVEGSTKLWENYPTGCGGRETPLETFIPEGIRKLIAGC